MLKTIWQEIQAHFKKDETATLKEVSASTGAPLSTVSYHKKRATSRIASSGTDNWETAWGQNFLKRMIISVIYTFGIKGGVGTKRISEHLKHLQIEGVAAVSESSIYRLTNELISNILWYKELQELGLAQEAKSTMQEMEVVLGLDETWLDEMLLVCQDLISGYLFLKSQVNKEM
ncbi:MAG: hypothetical protein AAGJ18_09015 [Bacteroidota bacterium]